jgi:PAS domain S-box-containing protein
VETIDRPTRTVGAGLDAAGGRPHIAVDRELRASEARYRSLVAATSAIVWSTDEAGRFVTPQPSWEAFTGQIWPDYAGPGRLKAVHPADRRALAHAWVAAIAERRVYEAEGRIWHAASREYRDCWARAVPMVDATDRVVEWFGCALDVTDRRRAEAEIRRLNETLEQRVAERTRQLAETNQRLQEQIAERRQAEETLRQAQKIEAVGQLTGGVAHDFNNLLTIILGNLELIERAAGDDRLLRSVRSATQAAERGAKLAEQLLAFSRKQRMSPKPVDINRLVVGMLDLLRRTLGAAIAIETRLDAEPWSAMVDATQIELVVLNLAINARDAMTAGRDGVLTISTANVRVRPGEDPALAAGDYVMVTVADTGTGMPDHVRARAFEPFFTTKEVGKGSGLGLSMVYGVATQLGGGVRIDSRLGEGTAVHVHLPRVRDAVERPVPAVAAVEPRAPEASTTILLVDDDEDVRAVTADSLRGLGHDVIEGVDGPDGLAQLAEHDDVALLLVDWSMPGMDGIEVARRARLLRPGLAVLLSTGYAEIGPRADRPADLLVLKKPYRANELANHIQHALGRVRPGDSISGLAPRAR